MLWRTMQTVAEDAPFQIGKPAADIEVDPLSLSPTSRTTGVRGELLELVCSHNELRELIHNEVLRALGDYHGDRVEERKQASQVQSCEELPTAPWVRNISGATVQSLASDMARRHFADFAYASSRVSQPSDRDSRLDGSGENPVTGFMSSVISHVRSQREQYSSAVARWHKQEFGGPLGRLVTGHVFESAMRFVIVLNCAFLVYLANAEIKDWDSPRPAGGAVFVWEVCFLTVYVCELILKLAVHRVAYFLDQSNCFDFALVAIDVWDMTTRLLDSKIISANILRIFRLLKLVKALRALQVVRGFDKLNAFLICIQGSLASLFWSLVMLNVILFMFSLCIVQLIGMHLREEGEQLDELARRNFEALYGSVQVSMLTLFQLTAGGSDWKQSYELVSQTGWIGSVMFLAFVSFTHIAVINIITGIFVESAMQNLTPDRDSMALDLQIQEEQAAKELEELFRLADKDCTGYVSKGDLDKLVKEGRLPRLLSLMGLRVQHARHFFKYLASATTTGKVSYSSFVRGCMKLKGSATSFDLHMLQVDVRTLQESIREISDLKLGGPARAGGCSPF